MSDMAMQRVTEKFAGNKSAQIRALLDAGYSRREIADFLSISYQFVYNVEHAPRPARHRAGGGAESGEDGKLAEQAIADQPLQIQVGPGGRIVIPAEIRAALRMEEGSVLFASVEGEELRLITPDAAIRRAQALFRKYVPEGRNLVDEFLAERRRMWGES